MQFIVRNALLLASAALLAQVTASAADTPPVRSAKEVKWGAPARGLCHCAALPPH
jgi:hypothetical protein